MPNCFECGSETPVTKFFLLRWYEKSKGWWIYFCSERCLESWVEWGMEPPYKGELPKQEMPNPKVIE